MKLSDLIMEGRKLAPKATWGYYQRALRYDKESGRTYTEITASCTLGAALHAVKGPERDWSVRNQVHRPKWAALKEEIGYDVAARSATNGLLSKSGLLRGRLYRRPKGTVLEVINYLQYDQGWSREKIARLLREEGY